VDQRVESNHVGFAAHFVEHLARTLDHAHFAEPTNHGGVSVNIRFHHSFCEDLIVDGLGKINTVGPDEHAQDGIARVDAASCSQVFGFVEPVNGAPDIAAVAESVDESADEEVGEFVGVAQEGVGGGEEGVGEQEVGDGGVAEGGVGVVLRVGVGIGGPVEEVKGVVWVLLVLDHLNDQVWGEVRGEFCER